MGMDNKRIGLGKWIRNNLHQFAQGIAYSIKHKNLIRTIKFNIVFFLGLFFFVTAKKQKK